MTLKPEPLDRLRQALERGVALGQLPGAVALVGHGTGQWCEAVGQRALEPVPEALEVQAVYDCASLTKVVCMAPVMARLMQDGALHEDQPVADFLPEFDGAGRTGDSGSAGRITLRHLLTHTSGLPAGLPLATPWQGPAAAVALACTREPTHAPGTFFRYSDVNFILLGAVAERVSGWALEALVQEWFFAPLGMHDSGYLPLARHAAARCVPTEWSDAPVAAGVSPGSAPVAAAARTTAAATTTTVADTGVPGSLGGAGTAAPVMLRGQVHDPTARRMGGVAGHAGLFSTAADLARFARMIVRGGELDGVRVLSEAAVQHMLTVASPAAVPERRSLGWDVDSPYSRARGARYPLGSVGHPGFTGCALWIDRASGAFHVLLSNRVHPRARESIVELYEEVGTLAAEAAGLPLRAGSA
jgi:CubicO group peptidase (beta-lactamase class C family)